MNEQQASLLKVVLERLGEGNSVFKDAAGKITAMAQGMSGVFVSDEVVKSSLASYTFEQMEIASYRIRIPAAKYVGDDETASLCRRILVEELGMGMGMGMGK